MQESLGSIEGIIHLSFDGGCWPNPGGRGGSGTIVIQGREIVSIGVADPKTTNNRMELQGLLEGLREIRGREFQHLFVSGDSEYVLRGATEWAPKWKKKGWPAKYKNQDLWKEILSLWESIRPSLRSYSFWHVYGHTGNWINERCDLLAERIAMHDQPTRKRHVGEIRSGFAVDYSTMRVLLKGGEVDPYSIQATVPVQPQLKFSKVVRSKAISKNVILRKRSGEQKVILLDSLVVNK